MLVHQLPHSLVVREPARQVEGSCDDVWVLFLLCFELCVVTSLAHVDIACLDRVVREGCDQAQVVLEDAESEGLLELQF